MSYIRKTPANFLYYDNEKGRLERIDNITWLSTKCTQCGKDIVKKSCLKQFETQERFYCCRDCLNESQRSGPAKTAKEEKFLEKYGVTNPLGAREVINSKKEKLMREWGVENVSQLKDVRERKSETMKRICEETNFVERIKAKMVEKYGCHWLATQEARELLRSYAMKTYGVEHPMMSEEFRTLKDEKFIEKHGVKNPLQIHSVVEKVRETCKKKYGVDNVFKREDVVENRTKKLVENAKRFSSKEEDDVYEILKSMFGEVQRHVSVFYRKNSFWIIDFKIGDVFVQYDGAFWHGSGKDKKALRELNEHGDKVANMQLRSMRRDAHQDAWFKKNGMKMFRIVGCKENSQESWLPELKKMVEDTLK